MITQHYRKNMFFGGWAKPDRDGWWPRPDEHQYEVTAGPLIRFIRGFTAMPAMGRPPPGGRTAGRVAADLGLPVFANIALTLRPCGHGRTFPYALRFGQSTTGFRVSPPPLRVC